MLNMQSANPGSAGGMQAPHLTMQDGQQVDLMATKTNAETTTMITTNHEGLIVSQSILCTHLISFRTTHSSTTSEPGLLHATPKATCESPKCRATRLTSRVSPFYRRLRSEFRLRT